MSAKVLPISRSCSGCRIAFRPRAAHHRHCARCHAWLAAGLAIRRARRLLEGAT